MYENEDIILGKLRTNREQLEKMSTNVIYLKSTDSIQTALNNATSNQTIILVDSDYAVTTPLTITSKNLISIRGNGRAKITFTGIGTALTVTNCNNLNIENISIICNGANNGHGIAFNNSYRGALRDVLICNAQKDCLNLVNSWWFTSDNTVFDTPGVGYSCVNHGTASNNVRHAHSRVYTAGNTGFMITSGANGDISNCDISGAGVGICVLGGSALSIENSYFESLTTAIQIGDSTHFLATVSVSNNNFASSTNGIKIIKGSNINIKTNYFFSLTTGIEISDNSTNTKILIDATNYFDTGVTNKVINPNGRAYYQPRIQTTNQYLPLSLTAGLIDIDLANNSNFLLTVPDVSYRQLRFLNTIRTATQLQQVFLMIKYDFAASIDYYDTVAWQGGAKPTLVVGKIYLIQFIFCGTDLPLLGSLIATY